MAAYDKVYLDSIYKIHEYLFHLFMESEFDYFDCIRKYLHSNGRKLMDMGNPLALNETPKRLFGKIQNQNIQIGSNEIIDPIISNWVADIYVYLQWSRNIPSAFLCDRIDPKRLYSMYYPLHETSIEQAGRKLESFLSDKG